MNPITATNEALRAENTELRARLEDAEELLRAIRAGELDALVVETSAGPKLFTLQGVDAEQSRFRGEMLAQVSDAVIAVDSEQRVTFLNTAAERQYGVSAADVLGRRLSELYEYRWLRPGDEAAAGAALSERGEWHGEHIHVTREGRELLVESSVTLLRGSDGAPIGTVATIRDITERNLAEEAVVRLAAIVESSHDALFSEDLDGIITSWNPGAEQIFGYRAEEIVGTSIMRLMPADRQAAEHELQRRIVVGELGGTFEAIRLTKDGREFPASITIAPLKDAAGKVVGTSRVLRDITETKRAEESLRENAALFSTLIAQAPMGTYVVDAQFRMRQINAEAMPAFGSVHPLIGRDFQEVVEILWGLELGGQIAGIFRHTLTTGERYVSPPFTERRHDLGIEQTYEWQTQHVTLPDGQNGVVCYFHEVTERAQATAALRANQERMSLAAEATGVGIWEWNVLTNTIRWDALMFRMYGIEPTPDGLVHYQDWSGAVLPEDLAENEAILQDTVRRCGQSTREFRILRRSDGECRWIQAVETVRAHHDGKAEWVLGTNLDVSERVATAEALRIADRRKDEFLATLAHELRNPLAPVRNGLQILRLTKDPDIAHRTQLMMERQLGQMVRLIDDLLEMSRISSGKIILRPERMELQSAVHSAIEATQPQIDAARQVLQLEITSEPIWLNADATRICQVVNNLLTNAAKFSPSGSTIRMSVHREGNEAVVTVADDGEGIPQNMLSDVFEMFTQLDRTLDRAQGGLGIGLALVRRLVELHGGSVTAESAGLGAGSTFTVRLPALADTAAAGSNVAPLDDAVEATKLRVLVVDDNVDAAESLAALVSIYGYESRVADSGASALALVREFKPALVLLDIGMPGMNGYETARRIRADDPSGQVTLAALTGWGAEDDRIKASEAGFDHHFTKPVGPDTLNGILQLVALRQAKLATASTAFSA